MIGVVKANRTGTVADDVVYGYFNGFFVFVRAEKTKKRGSEGAGARDGGRAVEDLRREGGGMTAAGLEVCRWCSWRRLWCWWWWLVRY